MTSTAADLVSMCPDARLRQFVLTLRRAVGPTASLVRCPQMMRPWCGMPDDDESDGWRARRFTAGGRDFAVLSYPLEEPDFPADLTPTEREVCRHILRGASNQEIAELRSCSTRTVANQVAAILRKLDVSSRSQVPLALARASSRDE